MAFLDDDALTEVSAALETSGYRTLEFGDSVLIERQNNGSRRRRRVRPVLVDPAMCERRTIGAAEGIRMEGEDPMRYMLLVYTNEAEMEWAPADLMDRVAAGHRKVQEEARRTGVFVAAEAAGCNGDRHDCPGR